MYVKLRTPPERSLDQLRDIVPVAGLGFEQREDQELGAAFFPFGVGLNILRSHIWGSSIWTRNTGVVSNVKKGANVS